MKSLVDEICPGSGENEICTRCFYVGVGIAGYDIEVCRIIGSIIANDQVATCVYVHSAIVGCRHVTIDAISPARGVDSSAITASRAVTLAGVTLDGTKIIHYNAIARIGRGRAAGNCAAGGRDNPHAGIAARVTVTNCAGGADRDPATAIFLPGGASNKGAFRTRYAKARIEMCTTIDHC